MYLDGWAPIGWATMGLARIVGVGRGAQSWPVESAMADGIGDGRCDHRRPMGSAMADGSGVEAEALTPRRATDGRTLAGLCFFCCYVFRLVISWLWIMGGSALVLACGGDGEAGRGGVGDGRKGCGMFVMRGAGVVGPEPHRVV